MIITSLTITPYKRRYRQDVRDLLYHSYRTHNHLDWQESDQWLDSDEMPIRLAWSGGRLVGLLATSRPLNHTCWLRLVAVDDSAPPTRILAALWNDMLDELRALTVRQVALLGLRDWILSYLPPLGFYYVEDIVTLRRGMDVLPSLPTTRLRLRSVYPDDIRRIAEVDQAAFTPPWQLSETELRHAERAAASCSVALLDNVVVGYQLSTLYFDGAHLARLAVHPSAQGQGVGSVLLYDLLNRFMHRGVLSTTVNTQETNLRSQHLYERFGFARNGYDLPVWMVDL